jgi:hypothetical protein
MALSIKEQIEILKYARTLMMNGNLPYDVGLCAAISRSMDKVNHARYVEYCTVPTRRLKTFIPLFTRETAIQVFDQKNWTPKPYTDKDYWWELGNNQSRIMFLDWMIEQLEIQLIEESKTSNSFTQIKILLIRLKRYLHSSLLKYRL